MAKKNGGENQEMQKSHHLLQNLFYFWNHTWNISNLFAPFLSYVFEKQSYHHWKYKWSLKYMLALVCPTLPPLSNHFFPQRCTEVPNPVRGSLRKFFVRKVFSKNSPRPTFFFTSNIAGFNFSAPAAAWIRGEGVSFEAWLCKGRPTGCRKLRHTTGTEHCDVLQHITETASAEEPVLGKSLLPEDLSIHALMQERKKKKGKKKKRQAFNLWWHFQPEITWSNLAFTFLFQLYMLWHKS